MSISGKNDNSDSTTPASHGTNPTSEAESSSASDGYFDRHTNFAQNPEADLSAEFARLAIAKGWSKKQQKAHKAEAIEAEFGRLYGTSYDKLESWQDLCREVGIDPVPQSITQCKKVCSSTHCS